MSELNLNSYEQQVQSIGQALQTLSSKEQASFAIKQKTNEMLQTLGEAKVYLSGRPVLKYALERGKAALKNTAVKVEGAVKDAINGNAGEAAAKTAAEESIVDTTPDASAAAGYVSGAASRIVATAGRGIGQSGLVNNYGEISRFGGGGPGMEEGVELRTAGSFGKEIPNPAFEPDVVPTAETQFTDVAAKAPTVPDNGYTDIRPNPTAAQAQEAKAISKTTKDGDAVADGEVVDTKSTTELEGKAVKGAAKEAGEEGGEEATTGILDAIPGADILGLIGGVALTIAAMKKAPHEHAPVDRINVSSQPGI